jgi:SAM-dependent methyltransferase
MKETSGAPGAAPSTAGAGYHDVHLPEDPDRAVVWRVIADYLRPWLLRDAHVLEIGAGYCCWINAVEARRKVAVDTWADMPRHAAPDVEPVVLDASSGLTRFADESFDLVLASNVIEHFEPDAAAGVIGDIVRLLRRGGRLIVIQPNFRYAYRHYYDDYTHRSAFTHVSLGNLLRSRGFRMVRVEPRFLPYSMRESRLPVMSWLVRAYLRSPFRPWAGQMLLIAQKD